jgi:hypothetical protein
MKAFGLILAIAIILLYLVLYVLGILFMKKHKYWTALKIYLYRYFYQILLIFIGTIPIKLMINESLTFDLKLPWLMIILLVPYVYDFIFLKNIKESIMPYLELDKESDNYQSLNETYHIDSINTWFTGSKSNIYTMCFFSFILYLVTYLFFYGYIDAIARL